MSTAIVNSNKVVFAGVNDRFSGKFNVGPSTYYDATAVLIGTNPYYNESVIRLTDGEHSAMVLGMKYADDGMVQHIGADFRFIPGYPTTYYSADDVTGSAYDFVSAQVTNNSGSTVLLLQDPSDTGFTHTLVPMGYAEDQIYWQGPTYNKQFVWAVQSANAVTTGISTVEDNTYTVSEDWTDNEPKEIVPPSGCLKLTVIAPANGDYPGSVVTVGENSFDEKSINLDSGCWATFGKYAGTGSPHKWKWALLDSGSYST